MKNLDRVLLEIRALLESVDDSEFDRFVEAIINSDKVVGYGAGRMGLSLKAFIMRLNHLGIKAYYYTDTYVPPLDENTLFIASSGSGSTKTVVRLMEIAKTRGAKIGLLTGNGKSTGAELSDYVLTYTSCNGGLNSPDSPDKITSVQPMSTLNEQGTYILFDLIALEIIFKKKLNLEDTKKYHSNLE